MREGTEGDAADVEVDDLEDREGGDGRRTRSRSRRRRRSKINRRKEAILKL